MNTTATRERPILFSAPMVRAILDGKKTQTRRVIKPQPNQPTDPKWKAIRQFSPVTKPRPFWAWAFQDPRGGWVRQIETNDFPYLRCPFGNVGDELWVRETFFDHGYWHNPYPHEDYENAEWHSSESPDRIAYAATDPDPGFVSDYRKRPSIHMPRWASRIQLRITDVRVERLQEISEEDAIAEGLESDPQRYWMAPDYSSYSDPRDAFRVRWDSINAKRGHSWDTNPWVWAVTLERIQP